MNNLAEKHTYRGHEINIYYDDYAQSPDEWGNDDVFIIYDHRQFSVDRKGFDGEEIAEHYFNKNKTYEGYWIFPLYAYIHSGVSLSLGHNGDSWDTSMRGFVLVKRQKSWSWKHEEATKIAEAIVEEWNNYLSGQVYVYHTEHDSCGGFYGDEGLNEALYEAKSHIDYYIQQRNKEHFAKLKAWIKSKVEIIYRKPLTNI